MEKNTPNNNLANQKDKEEKKDIRGILSHVMSTGKGCLLSCITIVVLGVGLFWWLNSSNKVSVDADQKIEITPTQIQQIQDIGQWEFLAINDEELVDTVRKSIFVDRELVRIYYGTLRLGIDLHKAKPQWLHVENDSIVVATLPNVELLDRNFIDEARTQSFFESGSWSADDKEKLYNIAYKKMLKRCFTKENIVHSRKQCATTIRKNAKGNGIQKC